MPTDVSIDRIVGESVRRAHRNMTRPTELIRMLRRADQDLANRLARASSKGGAMSFTEAQVIAYRSQIQAVIKTLERRFLKLTTDQVLAAAQAGIKGTAKDLSALEKLFTGVVVPLRIQEASVFDAVANGVRSSLLSQNRTSVQRYGRAMIADFERVMQGSFLNGESQSETIRRMVNTAPQGIEWPLWVDTPSAFPKPTGFIRKQYWAERIVRTEKAYGYNVANQAALEETRNEDMPDLQKKILAFFDRRTAADSVGVHGQVRPVDGMFEDGDGRIYKHPPARPNDRETVVPWRPHWKNTAKTAPLDAAQIAEIAKADAAATARRK